MKEKNLKAYKTFNQFFTREILLSKRPIENERDPGTLCSPCDGRITCLGSVDSLSGMLDCVKGQPYRFDEFLFGIKYSKAARAEA